MEYEQKQTEGRKRTLESDEEVHSKLSKLDNFEQNDLKVQNDVIDQLSSGMQLLNMYL